MDRTPSRAGGVLAIALSTFWALFAAGTIVVGVALILADDEGEIDYGMVEFIGTGFVVAGGAVLACAVAGIIFGVRGSRGSPAAGTGLILLFGAFAIVSGLFLASSIADENGVSYGGVTIFGLNTLACVLVVALAVMARRAS